VSGILPLKSYGMRDKDGRNRAVLYQGSSSTGGGNSAESGVVHEWDGFQSPAKDKLPELSSSSPAWVQSNTMYKVAAAPLRV
jgi:hypothetical protein